MMHVPRHPSVGWMSDRAAWHFKRGRNKMGYWWLIKAAVMAYPDPICIIVDEDDETRDMRHEYESDPGFLMEHDQ